MLLGYGEQQIFEIFKNTLLFPIENLQQAFEAAKGS